MAERRRLPVERRREEIIATALRLFGDASADEVSIDDIAEAAGASRALIYHYFGSKQALYLTALRLAADQLADRLRPVGELGEAVSRYLDFVDERAAGYLALLRGTAVASPEVAEIVDGMRRLIVNLLLERLEITDPQPALRMTLSGWVAMAETMALDWLANRAITRDELHGLLVHHLLAVL